MPDNEQFAAYCESWAKYQKYDTMRIAELSTCP